MWPYSGLVGMLSVATAEERVSVYEGLGLRLVYDDRAKWVMATADLSRVTNRVGGGLHRMRHATQSSSCARRLLRHSEPVSSLPPTGRITVSKV